MTLDEMKELFNSDDDEHCEFEKVANPKHRRADICAFLMLDELLPFKGGHTDIVTAAEHDIIYLGVDAEELAEVATPEIIKDLSRCGVFIDSETDSLAMFV